MFWGVDLKTIVIPLRPLHPPRMCMKHITDVTLRNHIAACGVRAQKERDVTESGGPQNIWSPDITVTEQTHTHTLI